MKTSAKGRALITQREGLRLVAYQDTARPPRWTIGVGHTSAAGPPTVTKGLTITKQQADDILTRDLATFEAAVLGAVKVPLGPHEFDALVSLAFNIGANAFKQSTVVRKLNAKDRAGAADAFLMWKNAGGKPILLKRRQEERKQFLTPYK